MDKKTKKVFNDKLTFKYVEIAKFDKKELHEYEDSLKAYRDIKNSLDTAFEKGHEKGRDERSIEIASALLAEGISIEKIMHCTGLTEDQIKELKS